MKEFFKDKIITSFLIFSATIALLVNCLIVSGKKYMWLDELLTYYSSSYHSFTDMMGYVNDKIDCGSPLYFISAWLWSQLFSPSALSLRIFSSLAICLALLVMWKLLSRVYGYWAATLSVLAVFLFSKVIIYQNSEARFYGMLLACTAILTYWTYRTIEQRKFCLKTALIQFFLHGILLLVHPFGFLYSILHILAAGIIDFKNKRMRPWYYISAFLGWILFIPFIPAFLKKQELAQPHFWIKKPDLQTLISTYLDSSNLNVVFFIIIGLVLIRFLIGRSKPKVVIYDRPLLIIAVLFLIFPVFVWLESQWLTPLYLPRYVIIMNIGLAILLAAIIARLLPGEGGLRGMHCFILTVLSAVMIAIPFYDAFHLSPRPQPPGSVVEQIAHGLPIVFDSNYYLRQSFYSSHGKDYYFVLDWEVALLPENYLNKTIDFQLMQALKRRLPEQNIISTQEFLATHPSFVAAVKTKWFDYRIASNPHYKTKRIKKLKDLTFYLVEKAPPR